MNKNYYITTPIYYPSAKPHMGHAYSSIVADFFARFKRIEGYNVLFLTGTDEHGLKIQRAAEKNKKKPLEFCNEISQTFKELSKTLNLSNNDFIRTTEVRHHKYVQNLWDVLEKKGETEVQLIIRQKDTKFTVKLENPRKFDLKLLNEVKNREYVKKITF